MRGLGAAAGLVLALAIVSHGHADTSQGGQSKDAKAQQQAAPLHQPNCRRPTSRDEANDCQQREAVEAAKEQARWALGQLIVGFLGVAAVLVTLYYTRRATVAAIDATRIAREALEGIERPFLVLEFAEPEHIQGFGGFDHHFELAPIRFRFANHGKTPALISYLHRRAVPHKIGGEEPDPPRPGAGNGFPLPHGAVVPAGGRSVVFECHPLEDAGPDFPRQDAQRCWYFLGYLRYRDLMGAEFIAGFCAWRYVRDGFIAMSPDGRDEEYNYDRRALKSEAEPNMDYS